MIHFVFDLDDTLIMHNNKPIHYDRIQEDFLLTKLLGTCNNKGSCYIYTNGMCLVEKIEYEYLHKLRRLNGLPGHPDVTAIPCMVTNTGSLGMGISKAKGLVKAIIKLRRDWGLILKISVWLVMMIIFMKDLSL